MSATFASVAEGLVSAAVLKRMMNHAVTADVTLGHYVVEVSGINADVGHVVIVAVLFSSPLRS